MTPIADRLSGAAIPALVFTATIGPAIRLSALTRPAILFIYPWTGRPGLPNPPNWDDIPGAHGSTPETEGFCDDFPAFSELGVDVMGLSGQDTAYQREFSDRLGLPFALLSDESLSLAGALALPTFTTGSVTYLERLTLYFRDNTIAHVFHPVVNPAAHAADVLAWLQSNLTGDQARA